MLKRTPLFAEHLAAGAKLVPFAGWEMPVQYPTGITAEHQSVRTGAGLFDVSHMGELVLMGEHALDLVQRTTTNDAAKLEVGQAQYSLFVAEDGTMLDDLLVYRLSDRWMLVVNASNKERDLEWVRRAAVDLDVTVEDATDRITLLALQGPRAESILARCTDADLASLGYYRSVEASIRGTVALVSRTGYTGEDGFEIYAAAEHAAALWIALLEAGSIDGLIPAGLGARDSLRLEMGYALYGNDIDERRTPYEAGLGWVVKLEKGPFLGRDALRRLKEAGPRERLTGFQLSDRGVPRPGHPVWIGGKQSGEVTSGGFSPSLGVGIGMAYLPVGQATPGTPIEIEVRGRRLSGVAVRTPFYRDGSVKS
jgi:aminomethyltransferase